jgi:hypothetical protein
MKSIETMNKNDCIREKISARVVGFFILFVSSLLALVSLIILPVIGLFFVSPLWILALAFILAPESKACRLLMGKAGQK